MVFRRCFICRISRFSPVNRQTSPCILHPSRLTSWRNTRLNVAQYSSESLNLTDLSKRERNRKKGGLITTVAHGKYFRTSKSFHVAPCLEMVYKSDMRGASGLLTNVPHSLIDYSLPCFLCRCQPNGNK